MLSTLLIINYKVGIVGQQSFTIISSAHQLFWIERRASYFEIQNGLLLEIEVK